VSVWDVRDGAALRAALAPLSFLPTLEFSFPFGEMRALRALGTELPTRVLGLRVTAPLLRGEQAELLARAPLLRDVLTLDLRRTSLAARSAEIVLSSPYLIALRRLRLGRNPLGAAGIAALRATPCFAGLQSLDLNDSQLGAPGLLALARGRWPRHLHVLGLRGNRLEGDALAPLASVDGVAAIEALDVENNPLGDRCSGILASGFQGLTGLNASSIHLRDTGAIRVAAREGTQLQLAVRDNGIGHDGARALIHALEQGRLSRIDLRRNQIFDTARKARRGVVQSLGLPDGRVLVGPSRGAYPLSASDVEEPSRRYSGNGF